MQMPRNWTLNTFDNITKEKFIREEEIPLRFDRKFASEYPKFPFNQILFILNFSDQDILNDVLEVIYYHCSKKAILELLMIKVMKFFLQRRLRKDIGIFRFLDSTKGPVLNGDKHINHDVENSNINMGFDLLN